MPAGIRDLYMGIRWMAYVDVCCILAHYYNSNIQIREGHIVKTVVNILIGLIVFFAGYTLGQGHGLFDYNGDGKVNQADLHDFSDKITERY